MPTAPKRETAMMPTLLLLTALAAPAQADELKLERVRATYGELGVTRTDVKYLPGDIFFLAFDIVGISIDANGKVTYSMGMEITDKAGKKAFNQSPINRTEFLLFGGNRMPGRAFFQIALDQDPGEYTVKLTVRDSATNKAATLTTTFEVVKLDFGIVRLSTSSDPGYEFPTAPTALPGSVVWLHFHLVGFERDKSSRQPNLTIELETTDEKGTKVVAVKPRTFTEGLPAVESLLNFPIALPFNRPGKYLVVLKATDNLTKKTAKAILPVTILTPEP